MIIVGIVGAVTQIMPPGSVPYPCWPHSGHFRAFSEEFRAFVGVKQASQRANHNPTTVEPRSVSKPASCVANLSRRIAT